MMNYLLQPKKHRGLIADEGSRAIMNKTIAFFEKMGKARILDDYNKKVWYSEFVEFIGKEQIFAKLLTPKEYAGGDPDCRWDTARNSEYAELLAFYGLGYWYCFQVTILGLGPVWMSQNEKAKEKAAKLLKEGAIFAYGLSEKDHGADIYSTETSLTPMPDGTWVANGEKYYIGNGNEAEMVSTLGKIKDGTDDYTFFVTNFRHKAYELKKNVVSHQEYVSNFALHNYPITEDDILSRGSHAWDCALNTVNVGKFNIGPASIGVAEHCFYEAITHASNRILYGMPVTDMPHARKNFMDAWLRLVGMKLYQRRASDYFRNASSQVPSLDLHVFSFLSPISVANGGLDLLCTSLTDKEIVLALDVLQYSFIHFIATNSYRFTVNDSGQRNYRHFSGAAPDIHHHITCGLGDGQSSADCSSHGFFNEENLSGTG